MRSSPPRSIAAPLAVLAAGAVAAALLAAPPAYAQSEVGEGVPPGTANSDIATDTVIADAAAEAEATGDNVEIESLGSADSEVYAAPDGTFIEEIAMEPFQAQLADGTWTAIDNTLIASGHGTFVPATSDTGLELSGGGDTVIASITDVHGRSMAYTWHEALPTPTVEGDTATYAEIIPGVDLKVRATNDGFAKVFEIKTPEAAASAEVATLELGIELDGFSAAIGETGALEILDYAGNTIYTGPTPTMWDATAPSEGVGDDASEDWSPSTFARMAEVATAYADDTLTLTPDQALLTDPEAVFPIRIDPRWVDVDRSHWALASSWSSYRDHNYYDGGSFEKSSSGTARLGRAWDDYVGDMEQTWRLAFEFPTSKFRGRQILDANLNMQMTYSWARSCDGVTPSYGIYELETNLKRWTWNNNGDWGTKLATRDEGVTSGCGAPRDIHTDVTDYVADVAGTGDRVIQFGLKVSDESACCNSFRRFGPEKTDSGSGGVSLSVKYNTPPNRPGSFTIDGQPCGANSDVELGAADSWTVSATFSDAEGDTMDGLLEWTDQATGDSQSWPTSASNGDKSNWTVYKDDLPGDAYTVTVRARDTEDALSARSGGCTVTIDTTPPEPPTVTSTIYPDDGEIHGSIGKTGRFTMNSISEDTAGYDWSLHDANDENEIRLVQEGTAPVSASDNSATIALDPDASGKLNLSVWAWDAHGNRSEKTVYQFRVGDAADPVSHWQFGKQEFGSPTAADQDYSYEGDLDLPLAIDGPTWEGGTADDAANDHVTYLTFDGDDDVATTTAPVIHTDVSYAVSASVRLHQTDTDYAILSQDGLVNSGFMLKYDGEGHAFTFTVCNLDTNEPGAGLECPSTGTVDLDPQAGVWYTVTAVYDNSTGEISLYIDGQLQVQTPIPDNFDATGPFVVGRDLYGGDEGTHFAGDIDDVRVWDRAPQPGELQRFGQRAEGIWDFESVDHDDYEDQSGIGNDLNGDDVEIVEGVEGKALGLNGSTSTAVSDGPVIDTSGDFTIGAWVRLDRTGRNMNILSQDGNTMSPFYFGYYEDTGRWSFRSTGSDAVNPTWTHLESFAPAEVGEWTHLAVVYDSFADKAQLFVNGLPDDAAEGMDLWSATGPLRIGSGLYEGGTDFYWSGAIDSVNVNTGVFDGAQVKSLSDYTVREVNSDLITGDFTGDGVLDGIAITDANKDYSHLYLLEGDGNGGFVRSASPVFESELSPADSEREWRLDDAVWRAADVNGDAFDDLVVAVPSNDFFEVWAFPACGPRVRGCNMDGQVFLESDKRLELDVADDWNLTDTQLQLTDLTGDERDDLVLMRGDGLGAYSIWRAEFDRGQNKFGEPAQIASGTGDSRTIELLAGDFDDDRCGDIAEVRTGADGSADVYLRYTDLVGKRCSTTPAEPVLALDTAGSWDTGRDHLTVADVTGDGLLDIVNSYRFTSRIRVQVAESQADRGGFALGSWGYSARCTGCAGDLTDWTHTRIAGGDVDGDGTADLVTLRSATTEGQIGAMWVRHSTGDGFAASQPAWADPDTCFGAEDDVNGDGIADAVIPDPTRDIGGDADAGAVWFVDGATQAVSLVHQDNAGIEGGTEAGDQFGHAVDLYDADGDGCAEIIVGIPGENADEGRAQYFPGGRDGDIASGDYFIGQNTAGYPGAIEDGDLFGYSVSATNLVDGTPVVVIGMPGEDVQVDTTGAYRDGDSRGLAIEDAGAFIYRHGTTTAWVDQNTPGVQGANETGDQFGWSLAVTSKTLAVGAPFEDTVSNTAADAGGVLMFDHDTSPEGWPDYTTWLDQNDAFLGGTPESGDRLGYEVAAADYWPQGAGPNQADTRIAIGVPWEDLGDVANAGAVHAVNLASDGTYTGAGVYNQGVQLGDETGSSDHLGTSLAIADLDPTAHATNATLRLLIGAEDEDGTEYDYGVVHITGTAEPAADIDTTVRCPDLMLYGDFGAGLGYLAGAMYANAPGTGGLYRLDWSDTAPGTEQTATAVS
ncbi:LamG domain-containing protein [Glycomyces arizonensis]|uniref:LamG domain-containing protein n=1 Tax=Glycomyces arizonensis TaxID=256035 RepID=UPI000410B6CD|nr:LamG domain-containing protein [Glycomyces arizonensis]